MKINISATLRSRAPRAWHRPSAESPPTSRNTIPGSLSFYLWEPLGVKYTELIDEMISLAMKRERERESITYSFDTNVLSGIKLGGKKTGKM